MFPTEKEVLVPPHAQFYVGDMETRDAPDLYGTMHPMKYIKLAQVYEKKSKLITGRPARCAPCAPTTTRMRVFHRPPHRHRRRCHHAMQRLV
jgi:hypothetical protein